MSIRNLRIGLRASLSFAVLAGLLMVVGLFGLGQMKALLETLVQLDSVTKKNPFLEDNFA